MSGKPLVWLHDESLAADSPAARLRPDAVRVAVLDDALLASRGWGMKRLMFFHESATGAGAEIWRGDTAGVLVERAKQLGCDHLVVTSPVAPDLREILEKVEAQLPVTRIDPPALVDLPPGTDLKRFTRYRKKVEESAIRPTAES